MKTYIVTEKHEILKKGILLKEVQNGAADNNDYVSNEWAHLFSTGEIKSWINAGWIEEIQKPEFTKDDMINFAAHCVRKYQKNKSVVMIEEFNKW